jgi:hypothetical protein
VGFAWHVRLELELDRLRSPLSVFICTEDEDGQLSNPHAVEFAPFEDLRDVYRELARYVGALPSSARW